VKDLTNTKAEPDHYCIEDKDGNTLTENQDIMRRLTGYFTELYNHDATGDPKILNVPPTVNTDTPHFERRSRGGNQSH